MPLALVTGASTGIGRATALRLCASGWTVLAGIRDGEAGERLAAEARGPGEIAPITLDVTEPDQIAAARERVAERSIGGRAAGEPAAGVVAPGELDAPGGPGELDALVNNAGIGVGGPLELVSEEELRRQFEVNVFAQMALTKAMLPALRGGAGRIVFVSSIGGRVATPFLAPYSASKHALEALADALRVELRTSKVQVALIEPGAVATPIWDKARGYTDTVIIPAELEPHYGGVPEAARKLIAQSERRGVSADAVASVIERSLTARRMRARYLVGTEAKVQLLLKRALPAHVFDGVLRRVMGV